MRSTYKHLKQPLVATKLNAADVSSFFNHAQARISSLRTRSQWLDAGVVPRSSIRPNCTCCAIEQTPTLLDRPQHLRSPSRRSSGATTPCFLPPRTLNQRSKLLRALLHSGRLAQFFSDGKKLENQCTSPMFNVNVTNKGHPLVTTM